ncbi:hypothetical protein A2774_05545 [Candidatus Roizmanbacteria bacterium RIFCSPHIGHO2_01_FULL_39_12c]|uniref:Uncharacterized protein n=1 Tax=Candidatus Roizmanbacteria bacterium RIFCSPHIGHO2_01_FULL_39_12c TaxID=1802031 RepID=A0A1F7GEY1_9BACT|nr:MAG: hypothetical protein A2774_05545 [Candidatus Roizmanbacteria bacterium RIFCSPHIGHO2_01_FULL_39_12c]
MNKNILVLILAVILIFGYLFFLKKPSTTSQQVNIQKQTEPKKESSSNTNILETIDYKASFAIFTNGVFRVFTAAMYHNLSSDAFIQADNPNIVHVKKNGITWDDFFKTLPFKLTKDCLTTGTGETFCTGRDGSLKFYLNGVGNDNLLDTIITSGDRVLITFGKENETQIQKQFEQVPQ